MKLTLILLIVSALILLARMIMVIVDNKRTKKEIELATVSIALSKEVIESLMDCIIESGDEYCKYCKNATTCNKDFRHIETCQSAIMKMAAQNSAKKRSCISINDNKGE